MICVYDIGNDNYEGNGNAVLMPTVCKHTQKAAGEYDLTITHPLDPEGKWRHIVEEAIIRAPVQKETIETAVSGLEADLYITKTAAALRSDANEPTAITYETWVAGNPYAIGDRVSVIGYSHRNYQCVAFDESSAVIMVPPPNSSWWVEIADMTQGAPVLVNLKAGTYLYLEEDYNTSWYKMITRYGLEGYIKKSQVEFVKHLTPEETQPRTITTQLFRIKTVNISTKNRTVTATAEHVSYDMQGVLVENVKISQRNPATAIGWIEQGCMMDYRGTIATDMTSDDDGSYTGEFNGKNLVFTLLDPDKGIVANFNAMYRRDNWDVFVMRKNTTDRGFRMRYGKNLMGVSWNRKSDRLITRVVPVAKSEDGSDFFLEETKWVDSDLITAYPVIYMEWLRVQGQVGKDDGTETGTKWTEETLRNEMQKKAEERFSIDKVDQVFHEVTVDFEMLGSTEEYKELHRLEEALMYDQVLVIDENIGLIVSAEVVEIEYDCIRERVTALKVANVNSYGGKNVAGFHVVNNSIGSDKLTDEAMETVGKGPAADALETSEQYTRTYTGSAVYNLRSWVTANFEPKASE